ncbi:MAG: hypothetical protein EHM34_09255, partial [Nitrosopumilales archaeon]
MNFGTVDGRSTKSGVTPVAPKSNKLSDVSVSLERDLAKEVLEILAPVFGATLPVKIAIQASILKADSQKL